MNKPSYSSALSGSIRRFPKMQRTEPLPELPESTEQARERLRYTIIGHATIYINTPWGQAAEQAIDDVLGQQP